jgi:transcriptional regulator with XRE-family HTH domain
MTLVRHFGLGVRECREARGWSQERLAEHAGLNRSYIGEIERGAVTASLATVAKLARAFGLPASSLVSRGERLSETVGTGRDVKVQQLVAIDG